MQGSGLATDFENAAMAIPSLLSQHAERRRQGLATVTVLAGPCGSALQAWRAWAQRRMLLVHGASLEGIVQAWLDRVEQDGDLRASLVAALARLIEQPAGEVLAAIDHRTLQENLQYVERVLPADPPPSLSWLLRLLIPWLPGKRFGHGLLPPVRTRGDTDIAFSLALMAGLASLLGFDRVPAILLLPCAQDSVEEWLGRAIHSLEVLTQPIPSLPAALHAPREAVDRYLQSSAAGTRAHTLVSEGFIPLPSLSAQALRQRLCRTPRFPRGPSEPAIQNMVAYGGPDTSLASLLEATADVDKAVADISSEEHQANRDDLASKRGRARSAAEQFLFDRLESYPVTAGCFALNTKVSDPDNGRPLEIDLCANRWKIAIEVDGHYHFLDEVAYRRDRRKDFALQRAGYLVLRCLATDVADSLEEILECVRRAIRVQELRMASREESR